MMTYKELSYYMFEDWKHNFTNKQPQHTPILLLGPPGIGKSSLGLSLCNQISTYAEQNNISQEVAFLSLDLTSMAQEDLIGIPTLKHYNDEKYTEFAPQSWWIPFTQPGSIGVIILDDISAAHKDVQIAARQLILYRRVGQVKLADNVYILITGNRREDQSGATVIPAHFRNSTILLSLTPSKEDWYSWMLNQTDIDPVIPAFIEFKPSYLSTLPKDADSNGAFATPRSWHKLARILHTHQTLDNAILNPIIRGLVGEGPGSEFIAFKRLMSNLVSPKSVLINPKKALPEPDKTLTSPDLICGLSTGLAFEVAAIVQNHSKNYLDNGSSALMHFLRAVYHCFGNQREYCVLAYSNLEAALTPPVLTKLLIQDQDNLRKEYQREPRFAEIMRQIGKDVKLNNG